MKVKSMIFILLIFLVIPGFSTAAMVTFDLQSGPGVWLQYMDIEESGAIYYYSDNGTASSIKIEIGPGQKLFRAIITADIIVHSHDLAMRQPYYDRATLLGSARTEDGVYHLYQTRDVVRIPIDVTNADTVVNFKIYFDPKVPGLTYEYPSGNIVPIDGLARMDDSMHFDIWPPNFTHEIGTSISTPWRTCVRPRYNPNHPMDRGCVRWEIRPGSWRNRHLGPQNHPEIEFR